MRIKLSAAEIKAYLEIPGPEFPKYVSIFINLANRFSQGTRPRIVGQMSDLIQEFEGKTFAEWEKWYYEKIKDGIEIDYSEIL